MVPSLSTSMIVLFEDASCSALKKLIAKLAGIDRLELFNQKSVKGLLLASIISSEQWVKGLHEDKANSFRISCPD